MKPSEVRTYVLEDHRALRGMLADLEVVARRVQDGEAALAGAMRLEGQGFLDHLVEHMGWEERYLAPALARADAWGTARAERLYAEHREQREILDLALSRLEDASRPPLLVARDLLALISMLRDDMEDEESCMLDERVLRDDVIAIEVETG